MPEFFVNGVRVFKGLPNSFSQLDEAIDNAFDRRNK
jgi:protein-disulfide isomerase